MGKGGGCIPSKQRAPKGVSDQDPQNPERIGSTIVISGQNQTPSSRWGSTITIAREAQDFCSVLLNVWSYRDFGKENEERG